MRLLGIRRNLRPVYLEAVPNSFIEYTAIDARQHGELNADIFIDKKLSGLKADIEIKDAKGQTMGKITSAPVHEKTGKISLSGKINNVNPWSAEDPQLYTAIITLRQKDKYYTRLQTGSVSVPLK